MKKSGTLRSQAGFSLVELMVVVAIIGVLAAMSAGQVQKQIAKARQSEAKTNLSSLYSAMEAYKAEWTSYYGDFGAIKFDLAGQVRYDIGFGAAGAAPGGYAAAGGASSGKFSASGICIAGSNCTIIASNGATPTAPSGTVAPGTFLANGSALIYSGGGNTTQDQWSIDQAKNLKNAANGIP